MVRAGAPQQRADLGWVVRSFGTGHELRLPDAATAAGESSVEVIRSAARRPSAATMRVDADAAAR
jgi:hypothetical protein